MSESIQVTWRAKAVLVLLGLAIGLCGAELASRILRRGPAGSQFADLADLRKAMLTGEMDGRQMDGAAAGGDPVSSVNLRSIINPDPDDRVIYRLRQGLEVNFQGVPVRTNSCGMRGPERQVAKPGGTYRVALLGDSFAFGWGVEQREIFAQVLEDNLNRIGAATGRRAEVLNFGVPGYSTFQEVRAFTTEGAIFEPDAILVFFVENDFALPFYVRDVKNPGQIVSASSFVDLVKHAADPDLEEHKAEMQGWDANSALRELGRFAAERGVPVFVAVNPKLQAAKTVKKLWVLRGPNNITTIDLYTPMEQVIIDRGIDKRDLSLPTDPHPSALKHRLLGDLLTPYFMEGVL